MSTIFGISGIELKLLGTGGNVSIVISTKKFHEDLKVLLETKKGTLIGDPDYGSNIYDLLYEPANELTANEIRQEIITAIEKYYSNIVIDSIDVTFKKYTIQIVVSYKLFATNIKDTVMLEFIRGDVI